MTRLPIEFETTLADGQAVYLSFIRETAWETDRHWGADADGRRGVAITYCDDDRAVNVTALLLEDDREQPIGVTPEIMALVERYLYEVPPESYGNGDLW